MRNEVHDCNVKDLEYVWERGVNLVSKKFKNLFFFLLKFNMFCMF